jgi:hypothetical protein
MKLNSLKHWLELSTACRQFTRGKYKNFIIGIEERPFKAFAAVGVFLSRSLSLDKYESLE